MKTIIFLLALVSAFRDCRRLKYLSTNLKCSTCNNPAQLRKYTLRMNWIDAELEKCDFSTRPKPIYPRLPKTRSHYRQSSFRFWNFSTVFSNKNYWRISTDCIYFTKLALFIDCSKNNSLWSRCFITLTEQNGYIGFRYQKILLTIVA